MRPWERRLFHVATAAVVLSGLAYFWMKYLMQTDDPFALVNHPWQTTMLSWHVLASPLLVLAFGIVFNAHVMKKLKVKGMANRKSGYLSLATFAAMLLSGYLLQVASSEALLQALVIVHVGAGAVFAVSYLVHLAISWRLSRRARRATLASAA